MKPKLILFLVIFIQSITLYCQNVNRVCCGQLLNLILPDDFIFSREDIDDYGHSFTFYSYSGNNDSLTNSRVILICCHNCDSGSFLCEEGKYEEYHDLEFLKCGSYYQYQLLLNSCIILYEFPLLAKDIFSFFIKKQMNRL